MKPTLESLKEQFNSCNIMGMFSQEARAYLSACLESGDIGGLLKYGDDVHHIERNYRMVEASKMFGYRYEDMEVGKWGWFKEPKLIEVYEVEFDLHTGVEVGMGKNGFWLHARSYSTGGHGSVSPLSVFTKHKFNTKNEALIFGSKEILDRIKPKLGNKDTSNYNQKTIKKLIKAIETYIRTIKEPSLFEFEEQPRYKKGDQLSLF